MDATATLSSVLLFTLAPVVAMAIGGVIAAYRPPKARLGSAIQHFAAGVVFAALAVEILPDVVHRNAPFAAAGGFAAGVALMLALRTFARRFENKEAQGEAAEIVDAGEIGAGGRGSIGLVLIVGIDILIDGLLIGVAFSAGEREGTLITVALAIELLSLGLATAAALTKAGATRKRVITTIVLLALLPLAGALAGVLLLAGLSASWMEAMLAFAAAALLYLVTEELLVEAHEVPEAPWMTAMFFVGFLLLLLIDMTAMRGA